MTKVMWQCLRRTRTVWVSFLWSLVAFSWPVMVALTTLTNFSVEPSTLIQGAGEKIMTVSVKMPDPDEDLTRSNVETIFKFLVAKLPSGKEG